MIISYSDNLTIVGTSHIAAQSQQEITRAFEEFDPAVVAIELDHQRLSGLLKNEKTKLRPAIIREIGVTGYLFLVIASSLQRRLGRLVDMQPGAEMKHAAMLARNKHKKLLLADRPIQITLHRLSKVWTFREKLKLIWDVFTAPFRKEERVMLDFRGVPDEQVVVKILAFFEKKYPSLFRVLVRERDEYLAASVLGVMRRTPEEKILLVIGAGHVNGVRAILDKALINNMEK